MGIPTIEAELEARACHRATRVAVRRRDEVLWMPRLVVELKNSPPLVVADSSFASVVKELRLAVPELHASYAPPHRREPKRIEVVFPSDAG